MHDHFWIDADSIRLTHRRRRQPTSPLSSPKERRLLAALFAAVIVVLAVPAPSSTATAPMTKLARVAVVLPR